jgi:serine/threonine protein phosphatase PrpC
MYLDWPWPGLLETKLLPALEWLLNQVSSFDKEILELDMCPDDRFIVLASDGVWEFLNNEDVARLVLPFYEVKNAEKAAEAVVKESYLRWRKEEDDIVDDITCIIIFLDVKLEQQEPNVHLLNQYKQQQEAEQKRQKQEREA